MYDAGEIMAKAATTTTTKVYKKKRKGYQLRYRVRLVSILSLSMLNMKYIFRKLLHLNNI